MILGSIKDATTRNQVVQFTCDDLRTYLNRKNLDSTGKKDVLVDRVWNHLSPKCIEREVQRRIQEVIRTPGLGKCTGELCNPITAQELHNAIREFVDKDPIDFTVQELILVIETLGKVSFIDMRNASPEALQTRDKFYYSWINFVETHPQLKEILDPHYVLFDYGPLGGGIGPGGPPGWGASVAALAGAGLGGLGIGPVAPAPAAGVQCQYLFQVNGPVAGQMPAAHHLGGFMQGSFAGLHFFEFALAAPPLYY